MAGEKRELSIVVKAQDQMSGVLGKMARSVQQFAQRAAGWIGGLARSFLSLRTTLLGLAAGFLSGRAFVGILNGADQMSKLADATGVAVERLSALRTAASFANVDPDRLTSALRSLQSGAAKVLSGDRGGGRIGQAFGALGISARELARMAPDQLLLRVADGLERVGNSTARAAILQRIFGDSYLELLPLLGQGAEALRQNLSAAQRYGAVIGRDAADAATRFADSMTALKTVMAALARDGVVKLAQRLQPLIDLLIEFLATNRERIAESVAIAIEWLARLALTISANLVEALDLFLNRWDEVEDRLARLPLIGNALGMQRLTAGTIEARNEIRSLADEVLAMQRQVSSGGVTEGADAVERLAEAVRKLNAAGGTSTSVARELEAAKLRSAAADLRGLAALPGGMPSQPGAALNRGGLGTDDPVPVDRMTAFLDGFGQQMDAVIAKWSDFGAAGAGAAQMIDNAFEGVVESLADVITRTQSGREAFKALAKSMLQDMARLISRLFTMYLLQSALGLLSGGGGGIPGLGGGGLSAAGAGGLTDFARGGVMPGRMGQVIPMQRYARGGVARSPQLALFGEGRQAEAFVPLPDGRSIPVTMRGGREASSVTHVYNIQATDADSFRRMLARESATLGGIQQRELSRNHLLRGATRKAVG